jgi:predicted secreted Zn-dependent protease
VLGLLVSPPVQAEPTITTTFQFYDIYPRQVKDIGPELDHHTPIRVQGRKFRGYTKWYVRWQFTWYEKPGRCDITGVQTFLTVNYTLPRIPAKHRLPPATRAAFDRYYQALFRHEQNHKNSGLYAAREIETAIANLPPFKTCPALETAANQLGYRLIERYAQRDRDYDRETDHGRLEGVVLP